MCAITGIFDTRGVRPVDSEVLRAMNNSQRHRGPDAEGIHLEAGLGLGHRRLSILDLSDAGRQPMHSADGSAVIVYNGEVYNFLQLRAELETLGHRFRSQCDTEVVVAAWRQWGERCVDRLRGMFAFAIWDRPSATLFLARDRLGIKPLYYGILADENLVFSSELKAILRYPGFHPDLEPAAVENYFALGYVPEPFSIFKGVHKLEPGHTLSVRRSGATPTAKRYWDLPFRLTAGREGPEVQEELVERLRDAVRVRLISDVPLGAFLSGGVDSSSVVAMMSEVTDRIDTCSISFGDPQFNESSYASRVAERFNTNHRVKQVEADDFALVDLLCDVYDEPYADSSALPTYRLCQLAREQVTVALSGDGGDESLAGYRRYRWHMFEERIRALLPHNVRGPCFGALGAIYPKADWAPRFLRAKTTLQGCARDSVAAYFHTVSVCHEPLRRALYSDEMSRSLQGYNALEVFRRHAAHAPTEHPLSMVQYLDFKTYLPGDILTKVDRASMAHSLEVRVPLLDHELVEWISSLPPDLKLRRRDGKFVFKRAMESRLPADILYRPKMGFAIPLATWFRGPLRERVRWLLLGPSLLDSGLFRRESVERALDEHHRGVRDHGSALWALLMFALFYQRHQGAVAGSQK